VVRVAKTFIEVDRGAEDKPQPSRNMEVTMDPRDAAKVAQAAYVNSQVACMLAEMNGMIAENALAIKHPRSDFPLPFTLQDFMALQEKYCVGHNAVLNAMNV